MKKALSIALAAALAGGTMMAQAYEKGDFVLRLGAVNVDPDSDSTDINLAEGVPTLNAEVGDDTQFGIIPMYMLSEKVGIELLAATPFEHDISLKGEGGVTLAQIREISALLGEPARMGQADPDKMARTLEFIASGYFFGNNAAAADIYTNQFVAPR